MIRFYQAALILMIVALLSLGSCVREYGAVIPVQPTPGANAALYEQKCSGCHGLDQVNTAHEAMTMEDLKSLLMRMQAKPGSTISAEEIDEILKSFDARRISPLD